MSDYFESTRDLVRRVCAEADAVAARADAWQAKREQKLIERSGPRDDLIYKTRELIEASPARVPEIEPVSSGGISVAQLEETVEIIGEETSKFVEHKLAPLSKRIDALEQEIGLQKRQRKPPPTNLAQGERRPCALRHQPQGLGQRQQWVGRCRDAM
jgi:hypothetical protein